MPLQWPLILRFKYHWTEESDLGKIASEHDELKTYLASKYLLQMPPYVSVKSWLKASDTLYFFRHVYCLVLSHDGYSALQKLNILPNPINYVKLSLILRWQEDGNL